jgi:hypothetical protein
LPGQGSTLAPEEKEIYSALVTAVAPFLAAYLLKSAEDIDENWIAPHVGKIQGILRIPAIMAQFSRYSGNSVA